MLAKINTAQDIADHKNYNRDYDEIIPDLQNPNVVENIAKHIEPACVF